MKSALIAIVAWYPLFAIPVAIGVGLFRVVSGIPIQLDGWAISLLVVPWLFWLLLGAIGPRTKSLSNLLEAILLGTGVSVIFCIDMTSRSAMPAGMLLVLALLLSALLYWFVPTLKE